jgi:hypothetical protein
VPSTIRIRADRIAADLAADRLRQEGIPSQVIADSDLLALAGTPMAFSIVVPTQYERRAREIIAEFERR